jgi:peptidoglycan hydrolase-like protein with peptidoglycan-binding domain
MKDKKLILAAAVLAGSIGAGAQSVEAQNMPNPPRGSTIPEKMPLPGKDFGESRASQVSSNDIRRVQEALKAKGMDPGPVSGTLNSKTQQALRQFQKANGLPVTGAVDKQTAAKLDVILGTKGSITGE